MLLALPCDADDSDALFLGRAYCLSWSESAYLSILVSLSLEMAPLWIAFHSEGVTLIIASLPLALVTSLAALTTCVLAFLISSALISFRFILYKFVLARRCACLSRCAFHRAV